MSGGPKATHMNSLVEARKKYSSCCTGLLTLVSSMTKHHEETKVSPFREWLNGDWSSANENLVEPLTPGELSGKGSKLINRVVKTLQLRDEGLLVSGPAYTPPKFLWDEGVEMRDCLRGHFDDNVQSHGRRPQVHAVEELGSTCVSILPSYSGGYMLTQEAIGASKPGSIALCLNKSIWRDRLVLEEGMQIEVGQSCTLEIVSITGDDLNLSRYSSALNRRGSKLIGDRNSASSGESGDGKKAVRFGESTMMESGEHVCSHDLGGKEKVVDVMTNTSIWADPECVGANNSSSSKKKEKKHQRKKTAIAKPTLVLKYHFKGRKKGVEMKFSPASSQTKKNSTGADCSKDYFSIGGSEDCDIVLQGCPVSTVANIVAFENVFTLISSHNLADDYHRGHRLTRAQQRYAEATSLHLLLSPEKSFGLYDGDTIVFRGTETAQKRIHSSRDFHHQGCCQGLEVHVQLFDPTEKFRAKQNKQLAEGYGIPWDIQVGQESYIHRLGEKNSKAVIKHGKQDIQDLALEVRAPVRTTQWDGSNEWVYGATEAFELSGITQTDEASIGGSPMMTVSVKDPRMSRCHATIFRKTGRTFCMEATKGSGKRPLLKLVAASIPHGLRAAASPPHLLLIGEVFRVGASEFHVIGFTKKNMKRFQSRTRMFGSQKAAKLAHRKSTFSIGESESVASDDYYEYSSSSEEDDDDDSYVEQKGRGSKAEKRRKHASHRPTSCEPESEEQQAAFNYLQEEAEALMKSKLQKRNSIALVRHKPNEAESNSWGVIHSSYITEDNVEVQVSNNVDKSFGFARINEYKDVLHAFGLDSETRSITYPELESFMIIQCIKGPLQRRLFLINDSECTIGSSKNASICVQNDPLISPLHCRIMFNKVEKHWRLLDCNSRTGTFIRATSEDPPMLLQPGQRFLMGYTQLRILAKVKQDGISARKNSSHIGLRKQIKSVFLKSPPTSSNNNGEDKRSTRSSLRPKSIGLRPKSASQSSLRPNSIRKEAPSNATSAAGGGGGGADDVKSQDKKNMEVEAPDVPEFRSGKVEDMDGGLLTAYLENDAAGSRPKGCCVVM